MSTRSGDERCASEAHGTRCHGGFGRELTTETLDARGGAACPNGQSEDHERNDEAWYEALLRSPSGYAPIKALTVDPAIRRRPPDG